MSCRHVVVAVVSAVCVAASARAGTIPERGAYSRLPGEKWQDGFVAGNGRMGALIYGKPGDETLILNHCRLFLPLGSREIVPRLAQYVPQVREMVRNRKFREAIAFLMEKGKEQGFPGLIWTDPYHPGAFIRIRRTIEGDVTDYRRTEDFRTGEVVVAWKTPQGRTEYRMFVSRTDNLIVARLKGPGRCDLVFDRIEVDGIDSTQQVSPAYVTYHNVYTRGKGGYDTVVRIATDGKTSVEDNVLHVDDADAVTLIARIVPWKTPLPKEQSEAWNYSPENPDFAVENLGRYRPNPPLADSSVVAYRTTEQATALLPQVKASLAEVSMDYDRLFDPHAKAQAALFDRVTFDLGCGDTRRLPVEDLFAQAASERKLPPALAEKMFDAGRYMVLCSLGELAPNLQGIWTGTWKPNWSGDFTLDTNIQAAMSGVLSCDMPDLMEGYFRLIESFYPDWRTNAKAIYGCDGFFSNSRASNCCLQLHWGTWQGIFWTGGAPWLAVFFVDYAEYTGDREFLEKRCVPLLAEIAAFYEDFLTEVDENGHVVFNPSYNPETGCGINATMDIALARFVLSKLIAVCRESNIEQENVPRWESLLAKLPPYPINDQGQLAEWPDGRLTPGHRHHSQLVGCYQTFDPIFETSPELRKAAQLSVKAKIAGADGGGEQSSFGRVQAGISAAYLGLAEEAYSRLEVMGVKQSMYHSLITSHEPHAKIYNTDGNGGIPQIVALMLAFSRTDRLDLLPALPAAWPSGSIRGLYTRCGCKVDITWEQGKLVRAVLHATRDTAFTLRYGEKSRSVQLKAGDTLAVDGDLE
ncbi:glycoside hydrolase N-terminal domain-containing protein [Thermostilla marina]